MNITKIHKDNNKGNLITIKINKIAWQQQKKQKLDCNKIIGYGTSKRFKIQMKRFNKKNIATYY